MCVVMIGIGYVGLVLGVCFLDFGYNVICVDKDESKILWLESGEIFIFEFGFDKLVVENVIVGCFLFIIDFRIVVLGVDVVFIVVGILSWWGDGYVDF